MFQQLMRGSRSKVGRFYLLDIVNLVLNEIAVQSNDYADANNNIYSVVMEYLSLGRVLSYRVFMNPRLEDKNVSKYVRSVSSGFLYALEASLVNLELP